MKSIVLLGLVVACCSVPVERKALPAPDLLIMTTLDPASLQVEWSQVRSSDEEDPVVGYRVKIWKIPETKVYRYEMVNGIKKLVEVSIPPKVDAPKEQTEDTAEEMVVLGHDTTTVLISNIELNMIYEVRVRAFTKTREGPLSSHMRIKLLDLPSDDITTTGKDVYNVV